MASKKFCKDCYSTAEKNQRSDKPVAICSSCFERNQLEPENATLPPEGIIEAGSTGQPSIDRASLAVNIAGLALGTVSTAWLITDKLG